MIKIKQAIIVEGKYDKITLENIVDATIIATNGFNIFKNRDKRDLIRILAQKNGIIVMTDSDSAGALIRSHIKQICPQGSITNVYVPQLFGKEKRKNKSSKEGILGVEGLDKQTLIDALSRCGIIGEQTVKKCDKKITKQDFFALGLSGKENSSFLRNSLAKHLHIPTGMSCNAFLDCVNAIFEFDEFMNEVDIWLREADKR